MKSSCLQFVSQIANDGECIAKIQRLVTALATRRIEPNANPTALAKCGQFSDEFVASHLRIIGHKRPSTDAPRQRRHRLRRWPGDG